MYLVFQVDIRTQALLNLGWNSEAFGMLEEGRDAGERSGGRFELVLILVTRAKVEAEQENLA